MTDLHPQQYFNRAHLHTRPGWRDLSRDTSGNPCVWLNEYHCDCGHEWESEHSCQCDDRCPRCDTAVSTKGSVWLAPIDAFELELWSNLPEA